MEATPQILNRYVYNFVKNIRFYSLKIFSATTPMFFKTSLVLLGLTRALDDSTMGLFARVDPDPVSHRQERLVSSLLQAGSTELRSDDSITPFSGIQVAQQISYPSVTTNPARVLDRTKIHTARVHLHDAPEQGTNPPPTPDVLICPIFANQNSISRRVCDMSASKKVVLAQRLSCTDRIHPQTITDLLSGSQSAPISFSSLDQTTADIKNMKTPISLEVTFGPCTDQTSLPNMDTTQDFLAFVSLNRNVELASENFANGINRRPSESSALRAGIVMVSVPMLFKKPKVKSEIASAFKDKILTCNDDKVCTAADLVNWVPTGYDWYLGNSKNVIRVVGGGGFTPGRASFIEDDA